MKKWISTIPFLLVFAIIATLFMRQQFSFLLFFLTLFLLFDFYTYSGLRSLVSTPKNHVLFTAIYVAISVVGMYGFYRIFSDWRSDVLNRSLATNLLVGFAFSLFFAKFLFSGLMMIQDLGRLIVGLIRGIGQWMGNEPSATTSIIPTRRKFLTLTATTLAAIPFASMLYGISRGKYRYALEHVRIAFPDLPEAFRGFRIVQISDVHAGSFDSIEQVSKGMDMIQAARPDMIVFTGDLVNAHKDEVNPYLDQFAALSAPYGKYSILGNHDYYGAYGIRDDAELAAYWEDFKHKFDYMGFDLMLNEHRYVEKGTDRICLLGVENWGAGRWFPKEGDLRKALSGTASDDFCVLLSHDPTHWEEAVLPNERQVHLTLSGHTHGMQFGVNLPGFKWSPVQYRYKRWMGLYKEADQFLYVNRGFGFLAFPGRVGMWPEITVIELDRA